MVFKISKQNEIILHNYIKKRHLQGAGNNIYLEVAAFLYCIEGKDEVKKILQQKYWYSEHTNIISEEDFSSLKEEKIEIIKYCLHELIYNNGYNINPDIYDFCCQIANYDNAKEVMIPFLELGQILSFIKNTTVVKGFTTDSYSWAISNIMCYAYGLDKFTCDIEEFPKLYKTDCIILHPSFLGKRYKIEPEHISYITQALGNLNDNGCMVFIEPSSFFRHINSNDLKSALLEERSSYSFSVVSLPRQWTNTSTYFEAIIVRNDHKGEVIFVDATKDFYAQDVLNTIKNSDAKNVWRGKLSDINLSDDLAPSKYIQKNYIVTTTEGEIVYELRDLISLTQARLPRYSERDIKVNNYLTRQDMSENYISSDLDAQSIKKLTDPNAALVETDSLYVSFFAGKALFARIKASKETPITYSSRLIIPFRLNSNIVTEDFLLRALASKDTLRQVEMLYSDASIIKRDDFLKIKIAVPNKDKQMSLCLEDSRLSLCEADRLMLENADKYKRDVHMKKHAIGQLLFKMDGLSYDLNNWFMRADEREYKDVNGDSNIDFSPKEKMKQLDIYLQQVSKLVENFTYGEDVVYQSEEEINIKEYLIDYEQNNKNANYIITVDTSAIEEIDSIRFNRKALKTIIDNITFNADYHGFKNRHEGNIIRITANSENSCLVIAIANNGNKIDPKLKSDIFNYAFTTERNIKGHEGLGLYQVKTLMEKDKKGIVELELDQESEFPVCFKLKFFDLVLKNK